MQPRIADTVVDVHHLIKNAGHPFELSLEATSVNDICEMLDLLSLKKVRFNGNIAPLGKGDWKLTAQLGATVEQSCVVTNVPVRTRIDTDVVRVFRKRFVRPDSGSEQEMPDDVSEEQLGDTIDLNAVFNESLSLVLPDYPRSENVETFQADFAGTGVDALTDETAKPFAGLAALKDKLS